MKKLKFYVVILVSIVWLACVMYWGEAWGIREWGGYIVIVPLVFSIAMLVDGPERAKRRLLIPTIFLGGVISILLSTDFWNSFYIQKLIMLSVGTLLSYFLSGRTE